MKNYYDILEVSQRASQEVIEKAYKALVKKYHPDLQPQEKKAFAEGKIKEINEAYSILSNQTKKAEYDKKLNFEQQRRQSTNSNNSTNINYQNTRNAKAQQTKQHSTSYVPINHKKQIKTPHVRNVNQTNHNIDPFEQANLYAQNINKAYNDAYQNAYKQAFENMGFQVEYNEPHGFRYYLNLIAFIIIFISVCFILWHIPFIKNYFISIYNSNDIIKTIVDIFHSITTNFIEMFTNKNS